MIYQYNDKPTPANIYIYILKRTHEHSSPISSHLVQATPKTKRAAQPCPVLVSFVPRSAVVPRRGECANVEDPAAPNKDLHKCIKSAAPFAPAHALVLPLDHAEQKPCRVLLLYYENVYSQIYILKFILPISFLL